MSEQEKQESQKTIVAFAAGLLIGGLLVWIFSGSPKSDEKMNNQEDQSAQKISSTDDTPDVSDEEDSDVTVQAGAVKQMITGEGKIEVTSQKAGKMVSLQSAVFPTDEGWIGVRDYSDGKATGVLGVARYSKEQGLIPEAIQLQRATVAGNTYALMFYTESGDRVFNLKDDTLIEKTTATFVAN